jgi:superfamily I DNA and RNA helicase
MSSGFVAPLASRNWKSNKLLPSIAKAGGLRLWPKASRIPELSQDDPAVLLAESMVGPELAAWLAARIIEVERSVGRLPSIAVFVDTEERIDGVVASTATLLAEQNIQIVGCHDGRDVGNAQEVRVFDVRHIKGLEFEAVFFVGVDALAERLPDLFYRYLYVGITRAATFLGITCENNLPPILDPIRKLVSNGNWV